ncbi:MAG: NAD(P)-dependent oxidoreductase [Phenylobacterium zucineum]|nr:MAG: NAD(P)-dependent oxidoreductase [Phenylobacterium zucineum]
MSSQPRFVVTGASGQLGQLVIEALARKAGPETIIAAVRDPARAAAALPAGVVIREADYDRPATLDAAFAGAEQVLLISSNAIGARLAQHRNAIDAARRAGAARILYTSVLHADRSKLGLAEEHRQTEALIADSGLAHTLLRNGWYIENYAASIPGALQHGAFIGAARNGRISGAARIDYAEAAAAALLAEDAAERVVHELAGEKAFTLAEFAAELSRQAGRQIPYADLTPADFEAALLQAGLPAPFAALLADSDAAAADGALHDDGGELSRLIGRPTTPFGETIAAALKG